jgi:mono/diheme cytochrome c family protein
MMRNKSVSILFLVLLITVLLAGCGSANTSESQEVYISNETGVEAPLIIPAAYRDKVNPLANDPAAIATGEQAYIALCSQCHGADGRGQGPDASGLNPQPADFTNRERMQENSDGYLLWRISEGGNFDPYNSLMTAWGTLLSEQEIWELISYLRTIPD